MKQDFENSLIKKIILKGGSYFLVEFTGRGIPTTAPQEVIKIKKSIAFYLALTSLEQKEIKDGELKKENLKEYKTMYRKVKSKLDKADLTNKEIQGLKKALSNYTKKNVLKSSIERKRFLVNYFLERGFRSFIKFYA